MRSTPESIPRRADGSSNASHVSKEMRPHARKILKWWKRGLDENGMITVEGINGEFCSTSRRCVGRDAKLRVT